MNYSWTALYLDFISCYFDYIITKGPNFQTVFLSIFCPNTHAESMLDCIWAATSFFQIILNLNLRHIPVWGITSPSFWIRSVQKQRPLLNKCNWIIPFKLWNISNRDFTTFYKAMEYSHFCTILAWTEKNHLHVKIFAHYVIRIRYAFSSTVECSWNHYSYPNIVLHYHLDGNSSSHTCN